MGRAYGWDALPSNHYRVSRQGDAILVRGSGAGHGLGLCQAGAAAMARAGHRFTKILEHYFPNTELTALRP
ncbi:MAG: hypothetical protein HY650_00275 [Acidobacteria bacterium]|nr:hypothetical protein [Acidobacteriota bacterium]